MMAGGIWDLLRIEHVRTVLQHLGYPMYLLTILGIWKIPCGIILLLPRFQRLKEWAYAGAVFDYTGAAASHLITGYGDAGAAAGPLLLTLITLASWWLRPPARSLAASVPSMNESRAAWLVPILILVALCVVSLLTLPRR